MDKEEKIIDSFFSKQLGKYYAFFLGPAFLF